MNNANAAALAADLGIPVDALRRAADIVGDKRRQLLNAELEKDLNPEGHAPEQLELAVDRTRAAYERERTAFQNFFPGIDPLPLTSAK